jgi:hypothetical protein
LKTPTPEFIEQLYALLGTSRPDVLCRLVITIEPGEPITLQEVRNISESARE